MTVGLTALDGWMIYLAAERAVVRLDDGRTGRLVAWRPQRKRGSRPAVARIEYPSAKRATVHIRRVVAYEDDNGEWVPLPRDTERAG